MCWILQPTMFLLGGAGVLLGPTLVLCFLQGEKTRRQVGTEDGEQNEVKVKRERKTKTR